tara:strand:- start:168 stop:470 length:303 start_codon:yes stop_codon:yes gene_type:complete
MVVKEVIRQHWELLVLVEDMEVGIQVLEVLEVLEVVVATVEQLVDQEIVHQQVHLKEIQVVQAHLLVITLMVEEVEAVPEALEDLIQVVAVTEELEFTHL